MRIDVITFGHEPIKEDVGGQTVIVIDVLRCTTTMITALMNGAKCVIPTVGVDEAITYASRFEPGDCVVGGERGGVIQPGFMAGNSPLEYGNSIVDGKTVVISTTNGTNAICGAAKAKRILIGALINCGAVARACAQYGNDVLIVCAGTDGKTSADDLCAAGAIINRLRTAIDNCILSDSAMIAEYIYRGTHDGSFDMAKTFHYSRLARMGFIDDIKYCMQEDISDCVPSYVDGAVRK